MSQQARNLPAVAPKRNLRVVPNPKAGTEQNPRRRRRRNPESKPGMYGTVLAVGLGLAAAGGGYLLYRKYGHHLMKKLPPAEGLAGALSPEATVAASSFIVGDVKQPVQLSTNGQELPSGYDFVPELQVSPPGSGILRVANANFGSQSSGAPRPDAVSGRLEDGTVFEYHTGDAGVYEGKSVPGMPKAIAALVTNLSADFARDVYERMLAKIASGLDWSEPTARDAAIQDVLQHAAPRVDWSKGLEPYVAGDAAYTAWVGTEVLGAVANQSYWNKQAAKPA